jgi:hypothetical protein
MDAASCIAALKEAAGRDISHAELEGLLTQVQKRAKALASAGEARDAEDLLRQAAGQLAEEKKIQAIIKKRNAALDRTRRLRAVDHVVKTWKDNPALGLEATLVGVNNPRPGARWSASAQQLDQVGRHLGGFLHDLDKSGLYAHWTSGGPEFDLAVAKELWELDRPNGTAGVSGLKPAQDLAQLIRKYQEAARLEQNRQGAFIGKLPGYIVAQSHDQLKIWRAGKDAWAGFIKPLLDDRTFEDVLDEDKFLSETWEALATGVHRTKPGEAKTAGGGGRGRNIARASSQERVLHFRDAESWAKYNEAYGLGNLREAVIGGLERAARNIGLMKALGTNPQDAFGRIFDEVLDKLQGDPAQKIKLQDRREALENRLAELDGTVKIAANQTLAEVAGVTRAIAGMAKLGAALFSQFSDIPVFGSEIRYQGGTMLGAMGQAMAGLAHGVGIDRDRRMFASALGAFSETFAGHLASRFDTPDNLPGKLSRLQRLFFKLNGMSWWSDRMKRTAAITMAHLLGLHADREFANIDPHFQRVLSLYGLDETRWNAVREHAAKAADGRVYLDPAAARGIPDARIDPLIADQLADINARAKEKGWDDAAIERRTQRARANMRDEIEGQLRAYILDRTSFAALEPDARSRSVLNRGTQPGTVEGELLRFIGQLKSFTAAYVMKPLGREIYGRSTDLSLMRNLKRGDTLGGMANLIIWTTLFGYLSLQAKELVKGRSPRPAGAPETWIAAATQGGGLGIFGDFLFGEASRTGNTPLENLAGPVPSSLADLLGIWWRARSGAMSGDGHPGKTAMSDLLRWATDNTPFNNVLMTRQLLNYALLYHLQEMLSPGYLQRTERRVKQQNGQTYWLKPSDIIATGGGFR